MPSGQRTLEARVDEYSAWVEALRRGSLPPPLPKEGADPLARLGRELELLGETVARREAELRNLLDLVQTVQHGVLLDEVLGRIFDGFSGVIPFERIGCAFLSDDAATLSAYWARSTLGPARIEAGYSQPMARSSLESILRTGQPRIINDLEAYLAQKPSSDSTRRIVEEGGRSSLTCPLVVNDRRVGFLFFTSAAANTYRDVHQAIYRQIASQLSAVIDKSRMYERLVSHNRTLVEQTQRLEAAASTDGLTGLLNRRALDDALKRAYETLTRQGAGFAVIMVDVDHFKRVNDAWGHTTGDQVLRAVARRLATGLRKNDALGRYGGEEFLAIVPDMSAEAAKATAERLRAAIADTTFPVAPGIQLTASFGVAEAAPEDGSAEALVARADAALYEAKRQGRNRCIVAAG